MHGSITDGSTSAIWPIDLIEEFVSGHVLLELFVCHVAHWSVHSRHQHVVDVLSLDESLECPINLLLKAVVFVWHGCENRTTLSDILRLEEGIAAIFLVLCS